MDITILQQQIDASRQRAQELHRQAKTGSTHPDMLMQAFEELHFAHERLLACVAALQTQQEELADVREQLESQCRRFQDLFSAAPEAYLVTSLEGAIRQANCAAAALFGTTERSLIGRSLTAFVPEGERRLFRATLADRLTAAQHFEWELRLLSWGGKLFHAAATVTAATGSQGQPVALRWLIRDITAYKQHEAESRAQLAELKQRLAGQNAQ